ncbi:MAG: DUF2911 domain-containing protein [Gemmatimonadota bacterium]|nr:DUF2911 domain-containing protein [Gemmatimonadota bacterium]
MAIRLLERRALAAAATAACIASTACAPPVSQTAAGSAINAPETGAFIVRLGADTVAVERFTRTADRLEGDLVTRTPNTRIAHYVVTLAPSGRPTRAEYTLRRPDGSPVPNAPQSGTLAFAADTVVSVVMRDTAITRRIAARNGFPGLGLSFALVELGLRALVASGRDSADVTTVSFGAQNPSVFPTRFLRPDSARITWFGASPQYVRTDRAGRILALDATATTFKVRVDRLPNVDIAAVANAFATAEQTGRAFRMSVRDTVRATVGRANLLVDYGRPLRRGRTIFGGVVPFDTVWRTGANAATQFRTDADLTMGGVTIPAGTYTLWTVPSRDGAWKLVINRQTGQWGTVYDPAQDLARVDLRTETVGTPVEQFTITVEPQADGGVLALAWDRTRAWVPFTVL